MNRKSTETGLYNRLKQIAAGARFTKIQQTADGLGYIVSSSDWREIADAWQRVVNLRGTYHVDFRSTWSFGIYTAAAWEAHEAHEQKKCALIDRFFEALQKNGRDQDAARREQFKLAREIGALEEFAEIYGLDEIPAAV